ncbi:hypothetical protein ABL78_0714 [Leptomonas seymouri]|uniref:Uncharacterized protein n=1 Tax=Leptomonas seymouri TaxID=5684 RepID=A0A0N0P8P7_LEPSE|nr:hypothetical protein ABL78_0714 [Leptomonas seymouri]|eukprot:KPI90196.1 hypothetical protein ABL78_0714 [Leptomonas seymouri]
MRRFLRLPSLNPEAASPGNHDRRTKDNGSKKGQPAPRNSGRTGCGSAAAPAVSRCVLGAMLESSLADDCRQVLESFFDNTQKFIVVVGCDGVLASRILDVYGARIVPKLKPSSLLPCLDAGLLDYFVDIVANSQHDGPSTLLISKELRKIPLRLWDLTRVRHLACAAASRSVRREEATASLLVYTFLYVVYAELAGSSTVETHLPAAIGGEQRNADGFSTEALFVFAVLRAAHVVLLEEQEEKSKASAVQNYVLNKGGIVGLLDADVPKWLNPLASFAQLLLSRGAVLAFITAGLPVKGCLEAGREQVMLQTMELLKAAVRSVLASIAKAAPKAEQSSLSSAGLQRTRKANASKSKDKQSDKVKGGKAPSATGASDTADTTVGLQVPILVPISELLSSCCSILLLTSLLECAVNASNNAPDLLHTPHDQSGLVTVLRCYAYLLQHQQQRLNASLWQNCLHFITYSLWMQAVSSAFLRPDSMKSSDFSAADPIPLGALTEVLSSTTSSTDSMLWLSPLVLSARVTTPDARRLVDAAQIISSSEALWLSVVHAAAIAQDSAPSSTSVLYKHLFPAPPAYVLGALCNVVDEARLQLLANNLVMLPPSQGTVLLASLQRMHQNTDFDGVFHATTSYFLFDCVPACVPQKGLKRLLDIIEILQVGHLAIQQAEEADSKEAARRAMQEKLKQSYELTVAHQAFVAEAQSKQAAKAAEQQSIKAEVARRHAREAARISECAAARGRKRQCALESLKQNAGYARTQREAARRERFAAYQQRLQGEYRVATFLEHLNLSSARVMEAREALRSVMLTITPDDLLEYLVSGEAKVPSDMMEEGEGDEEAEAHLEGGAAVPDAAPAAPPKTSTEAPGCVGERRDFWAEIMDHAMPVASSVPSSMLPVVAAGAALSPQAPCTAYRRRSFHKRVAPLLDLFFYEDGDEYGTVPDVLPAIRLRIASNVWPPAKTKILGFANLREAFDCMQQRGLVQIRDGVVQLTLLGFRYHFPFHDPEGTLEVHLQEARELVRALVVHRHGRDEEAEEEKESCDEEDEEGDSTGRLLPEVEFGI